MSKLVAIAGVLLIAACQQSNARYDDTQERCNEGAQYAFEQWVDDAYGRCFNAGVDEYTCEDILAYGLPYVYAE